MPLADLPVKLFETLKRRTPPLVLSLGRSPLSRRASRAETLCMMVGLGGLGLALGVTVAQATLPPVLETEAALRRAVVEAGFDDAFCPDGWAADHAALLPLTEAEVMAWYLGESFALTDAEVIASVGLYVTEPRDYRQIQGAALTRNQILLCIAESRRLVTPLHERIPPDLRRGLDTI
ncbi:hypothetical protein [Jannaschia marina]|uniref:hypothetical protein n=1 Tax=Jannaschia marina TaxID=2741674 RepID=UPI0015CE3993|nr:hypothetical protein [Jannaschia marina]